jgi:multicomponent Na+:H+ antiporter subunit E
MILLALNLMLAGLWVLVTGDPGGANSAVGLVLGFALLWWLWPQEDDRRYFAKLPQALSFAGFVAWELVLSSLRVAYDVITPAANRSPAIVCVPLDVTTDAEITLLANLITLTPGTITVGVSDDRRFMLVHAMFAESDEKLRHEIKHGFERRVRALLN